MTISVNDLWGTNIYIKEYTFDENGFKGTLVFNLYDHFGLDQPDVEKFYRILAGFRAWFVLQHYNMYDGKYKPFINLVEIEVPFGGSFT